MKQSIVEQRRTHDITSSQRRSDHRRDGGDLLPPEGGQTNRHA
jgi:hypothetical protein